jgi:hypothetical protein
MRRRPCAAVRCARRPATRAPWCACAWSTGRAGLSCRCASGPCLRFVPCQMHAELPWLLPCSSSTEQSVGDLNVRVFVRASSAVREVHVSAAGDSVSAHCCLPCSGEVPERGASPGARCW